MKRVILGTGKRANHAYYSKTNHVEIYTMEELCYYIYHNIESIGGELFEEELIDFIGTELGLLERAEFLKGLKESHAGIKDMVVSIFCSTDYYDEEEIKKLLLNIDKLYQLKPMQRKKMKIDLCMKQGEYKEALKEYRNLLNSKESAELSSEEYGDILHNIAVIDAKNGALNLAAEKFLEAYERNQKEESLKQYLFALKLSRQEKKLEQEIDGLKSQPDFLADVSQELKMAEELSETMPLYEEFLKMMKEKESGRISEYYKQMDILLEHVKEKYRKESV